MLSCLRNFVVLKIYCKGNLGATALSSVSLQELEQCFHGLSDVIEVRASGDGYRYDLTVVSNYFLGLAPLARQQWVYAHLGDLITSGRLHAITLHTWTESEWEKKHG